MDNRRPTRIQRFRPGLITRPDDFLMDYVNIICMMSSICSLLLKIKWFGWISLLAACVGFANSPHTIDGKQLLSNFMLSVSALTMAYMQNSAPMTIPFLQ